MGGIDGVLLDIDGVLAISWEPLPGAVETLDWMRAHDVPFRLITNTTTKTRADLAQTLRVAGFDVRDDELVTAVVATAEYLRTIHPGAACFLLSDGDARDDLEEIGLVDVEAAEVIVLGGASEGFSYPTMNRIFRRLMEGAALVGMHRNLYWRTSEGLELDAGAYIAGLEEATGRTAAICGKPTGPYFDAALAMLGVPRERAVMVGDDIVNDVHGAQLLGIRGALVKTGKFLPEDFGKVPDAPDHVLETIADLPQLLTSS
ncbi:MAG: TIGR01458 family HAD-type hydrolase [Actinobacteria bacterium]|nr:TIGR01458 family HAD-type hydrolase [Actinomycetota bacterium]